MVGEILLGGIRVYRSEKVGLCLTTYTRRYCRRTPTLGIRRTEQRSRYLTMMSEADFPPLSLSTAAAVRGTKKQRGRPAVGRSDPVAKLPEVKQTTEGDSLASERAAQPEKETLGDSAVISQSLPSDKPKDESSGSANGVDTTQLKNPPQNGQGRDADGQTDDRSRVSGFGNGVDKSQWRVPPQDSQGRDLAPHKAQGRASSPQSSRGRDGGREKINSTEALGRTLTKILRHQAVHLGLQMSPDGYVNVKDIQRLSLKTAAYRPLSSHTIDDVKLAIQQDNKQRIGLKEEDGQILIRANQGHSIETLNSEDLLKPVGSADEVPVCVHGTYRRNLDQIFADGLKRMNRNHVHFATGVAAGEVVSGMRSTCDVQIHLNVQKALDDGMKLYISENKVILTEGFDGVVPTKYFKEVVALPGMTPISVPAMPGNGSPAPSPQSIEKQQ